MSEKKKWGKIYMDGVTGYCVPFEQIGEQIQDELDACEDDNVEFSIRILYATEEEYDNAPEFDGW